jgi:NTP pyrophosphatase (non-canonical NTP hydrolase)
MITSETYVQNVLRTEAPVSQELVDRISDQTNIRLLHGAIGICTESGELMDALKKGIYYGKPIDLINIKEEVSDIFWYCGIILDALGVTMDEVLTINIDKLKARYPEKFTEHHAENRDLETERAILEG